MTKYLAVDFTVIGVLLAGYSIYTTITEMLDYYKVTFTPIPRYIVDEVDITRKSSFNFLISSAVILFRFALLSKTQFLTVLLSDV